MIYYSSFHVWVLEILTIWVRDEVGWVSIISLMIFVWKVCISNTRSASTESQIDSEEFREREKRKLRPGARSAQRQGETKNRRTRTKECQEGENNFFSRNPLNWVIEIPERKECVGSQNPLRINLIRVSTFHKCWWDPRVGLIGGENVQNLWRLINLLSRKKSEAQEEER